MGSESTRRFKVEWLKNSINEFFKQKPSEVISKDKLVAQFALNTYSTKRTGKEILSLLADSGFIKIEGDNIFK